MQKCTFPSLKLNKIVAVFNSFTKSMIYTQRRILAGLRDPVVKILRKIDRNEPKMEHEREIQLLKYF